MNFWEWFRVIVLGVLEGITEWLPISSTGHLLLLEHFWASAAEEVFTPAFTEMFNVIIQLGAIFAVITVFYRRLNPFSRHQPPHQKRKTFDLWGKIIVGCIPGIVMGLLFDDWMDEHLYNAYVVAAMLILYGFFFIFLEYQNRKKTFKIQKFSELTHTTALWIGCIQVLALVPGTSRSGVTILGAMFLGCSRRIAAEYSFFLAIPMMAGAGGLKFLKYFLNGNSLSLSQFSVMFIGMLTAYIVSVFAISFLMQYVKKKDFSVFGYYRIVLGICIVLSFLIW